MPYVSFFKFIYHVSLCTVVQLQRSAFLLCLCARLVSDARCRASTLNFAWMNKAKARQFSFKKATTITECD